MAHDFATLRLEGVTRRFGTAADAPAALDGLTLDIRRGEFIALLGPSGCGKSTALNCIAGLLPLSAGSIHLDELRVDSLPPERRGFGMVFQNYALFPHMTVSKNVGFGLLMRGLPKDEIDRRVRRALDLVQLGAHVNKLPGQMSGGQQQRVAIARAIVIEPPLILMDEPLSNLDAKLRLEMRTEIRRIHGELGRTTLYVTHDQDEALSLADRIVVMKDGRVQQVDTPAVIYGQPANLAVARFMGYRNELMVEATEQGGRTEPRGPGIRLVGTRVANERIPQGRAVACIRPDEMFFVDSGGDVANRIEAIVETVEYYGRESLFMLRTADGVRLFVRSAGGARPGDAVSVSAAADRVLVYPQEAAP
ncbi:ABC transporter ATP-binding protein [Variovorax humicola]|uniref:ABC transporter ATP-binding protein n=1 Tax=Variovorax humicola TaxID=1769758 RepID=A0ABU8W553_9BURK